MENFIENRHLLRKGKSGKKMIKTFEDAIPFMMLPDIEAMRSSFKNCLWHCMHCIFVCGSYACFVVIHFP
jgi:hypothetical protein